MWLGGGLFLNQVPTLPTWGLPGNVATNPPWNLADEIPTFSLTAGPQEIPTMGALISRIGFLKGVYKGCYKGSIGVQK